MKPTYLFIIIGSILVLLGAFLKISELEYAKTTLSVGLIVQLIGIILVVKELRNKKK